MNVAMTCRWHCRTLMRTLIFFDLGKLYLVVHTGQRLVIGVTVRLSTGCSVWQRDASTNVWREFLSTSFLQVFVWYIFFYVPLIFKSIVVTRYLSTCVSCWVSRFHCTTAIFTRFIRPIKTLLRNAREGKSGLGLRRNPREKPMCGESKGNVVSHFR